MRKQCLTRALTILAVLCFAAHLLPAQDLFEIKFTDKLNVKYKGLLVIFNDSKMYMRVAYNAENMYKVVNVDYKSEHGKTDGSEYLVLLGSNPKFITAAGQYGYNPDHIIFLQDMDKPYLTDDPNDTSKLLHADSFKALTKQEINDAYLREFYSSNEPDYLALRKMFGIDLSTLRLKPNVNTNTTGTTLHLIIAANTSIGDIGMSCSRDQSSLTAEFKGIASSLGISYKQYLVNGDNFTKAAVQNTLNGLYPGSNDIVIFVYRGHGFRWNNQQGAWPQLDMRSSPYTRIGENTALDLDYVFKTIKGKGGRLNIVLGDCCNSTIDIPSPLTGSEFLAMQANNNYNDDKLRALFMNTKGNLLATAASPGEVSWANNANGGFFTVSFLQSLREEISYMREDPADWRDLINNTVSGARRKSSKGVCSNCTLQNGIYHYDVTPKN
ncbi:MAG: caspase family protein [Haliscomenobacter sp.]|uniref:caspase family protein n=1 Tax=Haliscomenobacter sp. TaxID=2717303 RepID=UPI0029A081A3|nr:caspase family protein [Haliscomenobacter sp.]MDX2071855.1 caspase family protein [Haliscomenobacter sp.]